MDNEKTSLLQEIEKLEIDRDKLKEEIDRLSFKRVQVKEGIENNEKSLEVLKVELENSLAIKDKEIAVLNTKIKELGVHFDDLSISAGTFKSKFKEQVDRSLEEIRGLEKDIKDKKAVYNSYKESLEEKEKELSSRESELLEFRNRLSDKENKLLVNEKKLNKQLEGLEQIKKDLEIQEKTISALNILYKNRSSKLEVEKDVFEEEYSKAVNSINNTINSLVSKSNILNLFKDTLVKQKSIVDAQKGKIKDEVLWLEDQRASLNTAWDELKILKQNG